MALNEDMFRAALDAYEKDPGTVEDGVRAAIEKYLAEMFKPGEMMTLEPCVPARDYRKELWVATAVNVARAEGSRDAQVPARWANRVLADFDAAFPPEPNHG